MSSSGSLPRVLYATLTDNALFTGVVSSANIAGYLPENVYDYRQNTFWEATAPDEYIDFEFSSAVDCDTLFLIGGTIAEEGHDYSFQYWNGAIWVDLIAQTTPNTDNAVFTSFGSVSATKYRFNIFTGGGTGNATYISNILFGEYLEFERGLQPGFAYPDNADAPDVLNSVTQGGNFIGRTSLGPNTEANITLQNMSNTYVTNTWNAFVRHMQLKPFGFLPDPTNRPTDAAYTWTEGSPGPRPSPRVGYVDHNFKVNMRTS